MKQEIYPGDIKKLQILVDGYDITTLVISTEIFQDIFTPTWSATLLFSDTQNQIMLIPIKPGSKIEITVETTAPEPCSGAKRFEFYVYKIAEREQIKEEHQVYALYCVPKQFFENQKVRISKSFKKKSTIDIAGEIISKVGGSLDGDKDPTKYNVIIPNWSPFAAIEWLLKFSRLPGGGADFCFYQSSDSAFKFKSLERMFTDITGVVLKQRNPNIREKRHKEDDDVFINIEQYRFITQHDTIRNYSVGYYGNKLITHDIINKDIIESTFNYGQDIPMDAQYKPFDGPFFENVNDSHITFYPLHSGIVNGVTPNDTQFYWVGSRKTNILKLEENRLLVKIPGAACFSDWIGKQIWVELPSNQDVDKNTKYDKYWKGDYVVTAIRHSITRNNYKLTLELGKKRLAQPYS